MIRNVIFDWSGTLVDDLPAVLGATNALLRELGSPELTRDEFRARFRLPFEEFCRDFQGETPLPELVRRFHHHFDPLQPTVTDLPHARKFLEFCRRQGMRTVLLTTVPQACYETQTARNGFDGFIDHPYLGVADKRTQIGQILDAHGLRPAETLFIGDMQHDIDTARHGGVWSCAVLTGYNELDQLRASQPDLIVEHLGELEILLESNGMRLDRGNDIQRTGGTAGPVVTVGALVFDDAARVLMVRTRKWSNRWGIPGGKIKRGETAIHALRRELKEETNLEIGDVRFVLVQDCIDSKEFYRDAHFLLLNYTAVRIGHDPVRLNEEADEFCWLPLEEALRLPLNQPTRVLIEAVLEPSSRAALRGDNAPMPA